MNFKIFVLVIVVTTGLSSMATAQFGRWGDEADGDLEAEIRSGRMRPYVEVDFGTAKPRFEGMSGSFAALGVLELKLGYGAVDSLRSGLVKLDERYAYGSTFSEDLSPTGSADPGEDVAELGRFGLGNRLGYGWGGKGLTLEMYNQNGLGWTSVDAADREVASDEALAIYDRYGTQLRFGQVMEAGVKVHLGRTIALSVGAEGSVIFPRHVFWPWLGSAMLYSGVQGALEFFTGQITTTSPVLGPLLNFALKNGVSLAYYLLQREDMNWPFDTETPLTVESLKLGAAITF